MCKSALVKAVAIGFSILAGASSAKTVYVRCGMGDYTGHDGTSWAKAYETIQEGATGAASGDTVLVHAGVYDKGGETSHWWGKARVGFGANSKDLTFRSCKSVEEEDVIDPEHTIIQGASDPTGANGFGDDAYRCIRIESSLTSTREVIFRGFTLRGGRTKDTNTAPGYGGALQCSQDGHNASYTTYLVDCTITDCQAGLGAVSLGGTLVRCKIVDTAFVAPPTVPSYATPVYESRLLNCLIARNRHIDRTTLQAKTGDAVFNGASRFVNCTLADNLATFRIYGSANWYNVLVSTTGLEKQPDATYYNRFVDSTTTAALIAPTLGDYRVRKGSEAETAGDASYVADETIIPLPEGIDRFQDLNGRTIPSEGEICAGCCQETVQPVAGLLYADSNRICFDNTTNVCANKAAYVWPTVYPTNYRVRVVANLPEAAESGNGLACFTVSQGKGRRAPSWHSDDIYLAPPPDVSATLKVGAELSAKIAYAKPGADEATADGSYEHPYPTLQQAFDKYKDQDTIVRAFPGEYKTGGSKWGSNNQPVRLNLSVSKVGIRVVSMEGPEKTFIIGDKDPSTGGNGTGATMVLAMSGQAMVSGFTLTGGYSGPATSAGDGGARPIYSYGTDLTLSDCIITNNHGANYAVGVAYFERCRIADNYGKDAVVMGSILSSCVVEGNHLSSASGVCCLDLNSSAFPNVNYHTTFVGDGTHSIWSRNNADSVRINNIVACGGSACYANGTALGNVYDGFASYEDTTGNVVADPLLTLDGRPFAKSAAFAAAVNPGVSGAQTQWLYAQADVFGQPLRYDADGKAVSGAVQDAAKGLYITPGKGGLSVAGADFGYTDGEGFTGATIGMAAGSARPLAGVVVNAVTNLFDATTTSYLLTPAEVAAGDVLVEPCYGSAWYVDAVNGSDTEKWGYNAGNAFKTLRAVMANANLRSGDGVVALPGTYSAADGTVPYSDGQHTIPSVVRVPSGVTLESALGPAVTVIEGRASDVDDDMSAESYAPVSGLGPNAVRCVELQDATLKGFTLKDGFTRYATSGSRYTDADTCGGGVRATAASQIEGCIFTNCAAFRGSGGMYGKYVNCRFYDNAAMYAGAALSNAGVMRGCLTSGSKANSTSGIYANIVDVYDVDTCTLLDTTCLFGRVRNTLILGSASIYGSTDLSDKLSNVVFNSSVWIQDSIKNLIDGGRAPGCKMVSADNLVLDSDGRPVIGQNAAIDAGRADISPELSDCDFSGGQRVYNGALDCGALEADWRGRYARDMSARRLTVTQVSPDVVETDGGKVRLTDGTTLAATVKGIGADAKACSLKTSVPDGLLTATVNGGSPLEPDADGTIPLSLKDGDVLRLAYAGAAFADVGRLSLDNGLILLVR